MAACRCLVARRCWIWFVAELDARLQADTLPVSETSWCWIRWMNDQRFPWLVLVPKQAGLREWYQLAPTDQQALLALVNRCAELLQQLTAADKINIGALGNLVPQLHVHVVARRRQDPCWPGPVWGQGRVQPYPADQLPAWVLALQRALNADA